VSPVPRDVPMTESAPGRYQVRLPLGTGSGTPLGDVGQPRRADGASSDANRPSALLLRAVLGRDGRPTVEASGHLSVPFARELRPVTATQSWGTPTGEALLAAVAARTGGHFLTTPAEVFRDAAPRPTTESLRVPLLLILALLLVADVAVRRRSPRTG
jgi:hypothetical protein